MKILVLGGTQFVGYHIVKRLVEDQFEVITFNRGTRKGIHGAGVAEIYGDRHNFEEMQKKLKDVEFDYVVDVSGYDYNDVKNSYEAFRGKMIKGYLFISSSAVYRESEIQPIGEEFSIGENRFWGKYGTDKIEAEGYLKYKKDTENLKLTVLRPPYIYGEGNNVYREGYIFDRVGTGKKIIVPDNGKTLVQFIHIEDVYKYVKAVIEKNIWGEILNIGNKQAVSFRGWIGACMEAMGKNGEIVNFYYDEKGYNEREFFPFYNYQYFLNVEKADKLKIEEIPLVEGLKRSLEWYQNFGHLVNKREYSAKSDEIIRAYNL